MEVKCNATYFEEIENVKVTVNDLFKGFDELYAIYSDEGVFQNVNPKVQYIEVLPGYSDIFLLKSKNGKTRVIFFSGDSIYVNDDPEYFKEKMADFNELKTPCVHK